MKKDLEALGVKELKVKKFKDKVDTSSLKDHPALAFSLIVISAEPSSEFG